MKNKKKTENKNRLEETVQAIVRKGSPGAVLVIFPLILQTSTRAQMLSIGEEWALKMHEHNFAKSST